MVLRLKQPTSSDTSFPGLVWLGSLFSPVEVDIEHRLIVEGLIQQQVVPLDKYWPTHIPDEYLWMMVAAVAHASRSFHIRDLGSYNWCIMPQFTTARGFGLGVLNAADWQHWSNHDGVRFGVVD